MPRLCPRSLATFAALLALACCLPVAPAQPGDPGVARAGHHAAETTISCPFRRAVRPDGQPLVIAHRGASGCLPEHTLAAYAAAYFMGADVIEPDVVLTKDGQLICSHDLTLDSTTDVASKFPGRARDDGGHHAIDFTLAEIKTLEKLGREGRARMPGHTVATLDEMITLVRSLNESTGGTVGIIPEPKSPAAHRAEGQPIEQPLLAALARHGYTDDDDRCVIQCFDLESIEYMRHDLGTQLPLAFLIGEAVDTETLERAAKVCTALGPKHTLLVEHRGDRVIRLPLLEQARGLGFAIYPWTLDDNAGQTSDVYRAGVDGLFTNYPDLGRAARVAATADDNADQQIRLDAIDRERPRSAPTTSRP